MTELRVIVPNPGCQSIGRIPFDRVIIDRAALVAASDLYAEATGDCDEIALGQAIELYLEASQS